LGNESQAKALIGNAGKTSLSVVHEEKSGAQNQIKSGEIT
jgi:hypothetical protein